MRTVLLATLLLTAPVLTGCLGMGTDDGGGQSDLQAQAQVDDDTGGIQGVVTDQAVQPIVGAEVQITETGDTTTTASDGSFAFSNVLPGTYNLRIGSEGFISTTQEVGVTSGKVATVDVVLARLTGLQPYSQAVELNGFVECSLATPVVLVAVCAFPNSLLGGNATNDRFLLPFPIEENPYQMVSEVQWEANQPLGQRLSVNIEPLGLPNDNKTEFGGAVGESPIRINTDRGRFEEVDVNTTAVCEGEKEPEGQFSASAESYCNRNYVEEGGDAWVRIFVSNTDLTGTGSPTGGVAFQQEYNAVVSIFYHAPACQTYSLFADNLCEQSDKPVKAGSGNETGGQGGGAAGPAPPVPALDWHPAWERLVLR